MSSKVSKNQLRKEKRMQKRFADQILSTTTGYTCEMCERHSLDHHEFHFLTGTNDKMVPICHTCMLTISKGESDDPKEQEFIDFVKQIVSASQDGTTIQVETGKYRGVILD